MADPTLLDYTVDTWAGWTTEELLESVLQARGLTLDPATMLVEAIPSEVKEARDRVRRALVELSTRYKNVWATLQFRTTWTAGDNSIALPASCAIVHNVFYGGTPQLSLSREDYVRFVKPDSQGGGYKSSRIRAGYYRISGISDESATPGTTPPDYRMVLELVPLPKSPQDTGELIVNFTARAWAMNEADDANPIQLDQLFQQWTRARATEMWGEDVNDRLTHDLGMAQRIKAEEMIFLRLEGTDEIPSRVRWRYPTRGDAKRGTGGPSWR